MVENICRLRGKMELPPRLGALDEKHILLQAPINSGSEFINYKGHLA